MKNQCIILMDELLQLWSYFEQTLNNQTLDEIITKENELARYYAYVCHHPQYFSEINPMYESYIAIRNFKINCINLVK